MRIWNRLNGEPWAITETALQTILEIAARENESPQAVAAKLGRDLQNTYNVTERQGIAVIPVTGPLFRYANLFTAVSGASSYELIARDFTTALENPQIKGIILDIDSPGGEVNGVSELANMVYAARGVKPIVAYASGDAASGAYWIASAADEIIVSETSALGSIGVVGMYRGKTNESVEIVSSQSPHKRLDPQSDEGRARLQSRIDSMADVFISAIARNRNVTAEAVQAQFGGGDVLIGAQAVSAGLADRVGALESLITQLSQPKQEKAEMNFEALNKDYPHLVEQIRQEGAQAERSRIEGIMSLPEAKACPQLALEIAMHTEICAMEAQHLLSCAAPQKQTASFERIMAGIKNPEITPASDDAGNDVDAIANRIAAAV
jgi:signal peptide peptidase SppA